MQCRIPYGSAWINFAVPDKSLLFNGEMAVLPPLPDLEEAVLQSLDHPLGTPPLCDLARGKRDILFLVEDSTRTTPLHRILPVVADYLNRCGVPDSAMSCLTAPGTHRLMTDAEIEAKVGAEIKARLKIFQHDATATHEIEDIGTIHVGDCRIPVHINRRVLAADLLVGLGNIVPHCDAGFSGGAKILQPGVCDFVTTAATHAAAAFCSDIPLGLLEHNPCREGMEAVASKVGLGFIINVVKNCSDEVVGLFSGDFVEAHRAGAALSVRSFKVEIPGRADIVVISSSPADLDYWQAGKGVTTSYFAVREGGIVILAAPCPEGLAHNHPRLREWLALPHHEILRRLRNFDPEDTDADVIAAVIASCNSRARERAQIFVVSDGLSEEDVKALGFTRFRSVQSALDEALAQRPRASIGVIPRGGIALPIVTPN